ncbi:MAG: helix-hairpin-helix domain-containing protein [Gammaproteobacteria bacterium]|nr:helix-hairpin-helix domain-containing protein [Gammaproteobacteria bacterium]
MFYKLRSIIVYSSLAFLITSGNVTSANPAKVTNKPIQNPVAATSKKPDKQKQIIGININSADIATLQKINGMSKKKAQAIVDYRTKNGFFSSLDDLLKVKCRGIHKNWLDKVSKFLTF